MATYQIWADITKIADDRYFVTVSAVPKDERTQARIAHTLATGRPLRN